MDDRLYDEFGNYIGPEIDRKSDGEAGAAYEKPIKVHRRIRFDDDANPDGINSDNDMDDRNFPEGYTHPNMYDEFGNYIEPEGESDEEGEDNMEEDDDEEGVDDEEGEEDNEGEDLLPFMSDPFSIRNVALVGHIGHGKTVFMDMLVIHTHDIPIENVPKISSPKRKYTDTSFLEKCKNMSIKAIPMSFVLKDSEAKSYLCNIMDTPGHVEFNDEMTAALRLADGAVLIVDAAEGVMLNTRRAICHAINERLPIVLIINKIDMLITKLKLSPNEAHDKLRNIIEGVNSQINAVSSTAGGAQILDPIVGNVCFASASAGWSFTLQSFAKLYVKRHRVPIDALLFASQLWGAKYYYPDTLDFKGEPPSNGRNRSFVQLILEPLYEIYGLVSTERQVSVLQATLGKFGVKLPDSAYSLTFSPLLRLVCSSLFGTATGFTDMLVQHIPSAKEAVASRVEHIFNGPKDSPAYNAIKDCDPSGPLMVNVTKLYRKKSSYGKIVFDVLGRVFSGEIQTGQTVQVLREDFSPDNGEEDDMTSKEVTKLWVYQACYRIPVSRAPAGSWVLIEGVDTSIVKTATLTHVEDAGDAYPFKPLRFNTLPVVKIVIGPLDRKLSSSGFHMISKIYPLAIVRSEKSGYPIQEGAEESYEWTISGTGTLYLDCIMRDLGNHYGKDLMNVADRNVSFRETVEQSSSVKCFAEIPNKKNTITMIAEPLEKGLAEDIENGVVSMSHWNFPAARSIWAFGPDKQEPNILLADDLPSEVDNSWLKDFIVQGFQWGTREGPLCNEPIRDVNFRIVDAKISPEHLHQNKGRIIRTAQRAALSAFLMASPRLMEPVFYVEIQTPIGLVSEITRLLSLRRGNVMIDVPRPGARPPYIVKAQLPVTESFGFETEVEQITGAQALCLLVFDHWDIVPGDPLQAPALMIPGDPLQTPTLAREFVMKTRRRKGKSEDDVNINELINEDT
ncbi:hypothetical protein MKW92_040772 [Papaver armeniacum]|nr:hypothetical protein MKW92_040772 [Papaver armeniacum]